MEPLLYVMAIMGCSDAGAFCADERMIETRYVSLAACQTASQEQLLEHSDLSYPVIMASCRPITNQIAANEAPRPRG